MPRVHFVKKARKPIKSAGIKVGESYYWWKFLRGSKQVSKTYPKPSQLTQSEFLSQMYEFEEQAAGLAGEGCDPEEVASSLESLADEVRDLGGEQESRADNVEGAFSGGSPTIDLLRERASKCEEVADALESAASEIRELEGAEEEADPEDEDGIEEDPAEAEFNRVQEIASIIEAIDWSVE